MAARTSTQVRLSDDGLAALDKIADDEFEGNRSLALRRLLAIGLAAWSAGVRKPDEVKRA